MINKDNPVWCDVMKAWLAFSDVGEFHTREYILEKLERILKGTSSWHPKVEEAFQELLESEYWKKVKNKEFKQQP